MVKDLGLSRLSLGDKRLIQYIEHVLTDTLKFGFNFLAIVTNSAYVLVRAFGLFFLFNR